MDSYFAENQTPSQTKRSSHLSLAIKLFLCLLIAAPFGLAQSHNGLSNDSAGCGDGQPCFNDHYQDGNNVVFKFTGTSGFDFYNVRYNVVSGGQKQQVSKDGVWVIYNVKPRSTYTISVQGCKSRFAASSICSVWLQDSFTTR